jgi:hypothetical protein
MILGAGIRWSGVVNSRRWSILVPGLPETWRVLIPGLGRRWPILVPGWAETWPVLGPIKPP